MTFVSENVTRNVRTNDIEPRPGMICLSQEFELGKAIGEDEIGRYLRPQHAA